MACLSFAQMSEGKHRLYLFPGQGSDSALFSEMQLPDSFDIQYMELPTPERGEVMFDYASRFISQIDTSSPFSLIGVSLGGMICSELADLLNPEYVILISSAKSSLELPARYRFQRKFPIHKIIPKEWYKSGALFLQPIVEPDRKLHKSTFVRMLSSKDETYMKRTVHLIVNWDKTDYNHNIIHIHGNNDHTIPIKNVNATIEVEGGSHMMALTRGKEMGSIITRILVGK